MSNNLQQTRATPGAALQTALYLINSLIQPFPPTAIQPRHAQTDRDMCSSHKIDYVILIKTFLNPGHQNPISGSKVTTILLKGWILPIGGASAGEGLPCSLRSTLVISLGQFLIHSHLQTRCSRGYFTHSVVSD